MMILIVEFGTKVYPTSVPTSISGPKYKFLKYFCKFWAEIGESGENSFPGLTKRIILLSRTIAEIWFFYLWLFFCAILTQQ